MRAEGHPDGFSIFPIDRQRFTRSQAFKFANLGVTGDALVSLLISQICRYVEGGTAYCATDYARESIRGIARHAEKKTEEPRGKKLAEFYDKPQEFSEGLEIYGEIPVPQRVDVLRDILSQFPSRLTCEEADQRLADGMNLVGVEPYDKRKDRTVVYDLRRELGF